MVPRRRAISGGGIKQRSSFVLDVLKVLVCVFPVRAVVLPSNVLLILLLTLLLFILLVLLLPLLLLLLIAPPLLPFVPLSVPEDG